jgi:hypothetical protein
MTGITLPDKFHQRAITSLRERHEKQIREDAERIQEHIGYVLRRIGQDQTHSAGLYIADIAAAASRMGQHIAALEAIDEGLAILVTADEPETTGEPS